MSGRIQRNTGIKRLYDEIRIDYKRLDAGCRRHGVTATMFRTAKFVFHIAVLAFTVYLLQTTGIEPTVAVAMSVLMISGPEGLEAWLTRQGTQDTSDDGDDTET